MRQAYHNIYLNPKERPLLGLVSFQVFCPSPCTTSFMLLVMDLGPTFGDFSSSGSPLCILCFWVWSFVWT